MDLKSMAVVLLFSAVCGVSAYVPHRYHFVNESKNWTEAQSYCRQTYTDLASINNMEEMKDLSATLKEKAGSYVWIGLEKGNTGKWLWSLAEGHVYSEGDAYRNWSPGEPNNIGGKEFCVVMKQSDGTWLDDNCNTQRTFMCYDEKKTNTERYRFINNNMTWREAQSYCRNDYTDLVSVKNQTENQQIYTARQKLKDDGFWIGLFNDSWKWSDQSTSLFRYWARNQPDNGHENCAAVFMTTQDAVGGWHDVTCEKKIPFVCRENQLILIMQNLTWREALRYCRVKHVDLVSVHSEEIQLWVKEVAQNASTEHVWLGLRHTCTLSFWFWVSGESICYQNWAPGKGTGGEDCSSGERTGAVQSRGGQQWVSLPEDQELNFICTTYEAVCGVSAYVPHRYHFLKESKTWTEAQSYCRQTYTDLASINNMEEMKDLNTTLKEKAVSHIWIGLEKGNTGKWQWSLAEGNFYSERDAYRNWSPGEPNNIRGKEFCVVMKKTDGTWFDDECSIPFPFMCYDDKLILIKQNLTWREALRYCRDNHLDLVSVHSEEIQLWVMEVAQKASTEHVWLGLCHTCSPGFWYWLNVSPICYQNWAPGNGTGGEDCSTVERTGAVQSRGGQQWVSLPEDQKLNFICLTYEAVCGVSTYVPHRYHFVNENKNWTEAQSYCRQTYTDLATISNMEEMKDLSATLKDTARSLVWIGLEKGNTGKWLWSLAEGNFYSERDAYRSWSSGEPNNNGGKEFCVAMKKIDGTWIDDDCGTERTFMCYDEKKTNTERYRLINSKMTWRDAQSYCRNYYTDLVSVRNQTENQQIYTAAQTSKDEYLWIGLFNDAWKWSDQSTSSFRYWAPNQPDNNGEKENCAAVSMTTQDAVGGWHDVNCEVKIPFICRENQLILIKLNLTWREALRYCRDNHVDLVSVHSEEIQLWVKAVAQNASTEHVWLGLRHTCTLSFWFWVSGESICYQNWAPGNGTGGEDCSSVERTGAVQSRGGQQWVSLPEDHKLNFICLTYEG
ncbi:hypothetical protein MHYP_G00091730 [Metynnis hypsauchen]